ncbi:hypothetical protein [Bradyrhizobium sp. USDA 4508]
MFRIASQPWSISFLLAAALAWSGIAAAVLTDARGKPATPTPAEVHRHAPVAFEDRWQPTESVPAKKQDRLPLFVPAPQPKPAVLFAPEPLPQPAQAERVMAQTKVKVIRDVCQRHGMRKVKHGRYGWRCRR